MINYKCTHNSKGKRTEYMRIMANSVFANISGRNVNIFSFYTMKRRRKEEENADVNHRLYKNVFSILGVDL